MRILVIGSGGREHALCWRLRSDGHQLWALPGNVGIANVAECVPGDVSDLPSVVRVAKSTRADLVVVGPEVPLVAGLADLLRAADIAVFGPGAQGAQLEGSKKYAKSFFLRHGIPSARFFACQNRGDLQAAIRALGNRVVVKADGLAAGKGVVVCSYAREALQAGMAMMEESSFGAEGATIVVEERLEGRELSVMALCDGHRCEVLESAEDHKTIFDGDVGANTGGMGAVSPPSWVREKLLGRIRREILDPTVAGLRSDGIEFRGVLYAGLMVEKGGKPWLLEYNVRFGDPETQAVLTRMKSDLGLWLLGAAMGALPEGHISWSEEAAVCVVLASAGYPAKGRKGDVIRGVPVAESLSQVQVFHAATARRGQELLTAGGRVLGVTARGGSAAIARCAAYAAVDAIDFEGMQYRQDIGGREK